MECSQFLIQSVLCCLINYGTPGSTKKLRLSLEDEHFSSDHLLWWDEGVEPDAPSPDDAKDFLASVKSLELWFTFFPWDSAAYANLVNLFINLSMCGIGNTVFTQYQLATILSSSPRLRTLYPDLDSPCKHRQDLVDPIPLTNLRSLTLEPRGPAGCLGILPLIAPG